MAETRQGLGEGICHARVRLVGSPFSGDLIALLALFLAVGGGSALASYIITSNGQVGPNTISGHHPPSGDHSNVISGSLTGQDLATGAVSAGKLATGVVAEYGASAPGAQNFTSDTSSFLALATVNLPGAGTYFVTAKTVFSATSSTATLRAQASCLLSPRRAAGTDDADWISPLVAVPGGYQADGTASLELPVTTAGADQVSLSCRNLSSAGVTINAYFSRVDAVKTTSNN